ncbi:MAG: XdhC family protein [Armatimonadota bacterium]
MSGRERSPGRSPETRRTTGAVGRGLREGRDGGAGSTNPAPNSRSVFTEIVRLQRAGQRAVLATPLWFTGSVPLVAESKLLLREDGTMLGTVGGGLLEARVIEAARQVLACGEPQILGFELTADQAARAGMICGGRCAVLVEPIEPDTDAAVYAAVAEAAGSHQPVVMATLFSETHTAKIAFVNGELILDQSAADSSTPRLLDSSSLRAIAEEILESGRPRFIEEPLRVHLDPLIPPPTAFIFGAGHVAIPVAHLAGLVGFRVVVIDDRAEFANRERFPNADDVMVASVEDAFSGIAVDGNSYVVTITRGHAMDEEVVAHALRTPARYIGMIGSKRKVAGVLGRLRERGFTDADLSRVHAPIGLDINAETVEEIAVSIIAELIAVRRGS